MVRCVRPWKAPLKVIDAGTARGVLGQLDGVLDRLGARVGEEDHVEVAGDDLRELLGEVHRRLVVEHVGLRVDDLAALVLGGLDDLGMAVAGVGDGDAHAEVEPLLAVGAVHPRALGVVDRELRDVADG